MRWSTFFISVSLLAFLGLSTLGYFSWKKLAPEFPALQEKANETILLKREPGKANRNEDKEFGFEDWKDKLAKREETRAAKKEEYLQRQKELLEKPRPLGMDPRVDWRRLTAWERSLLLREKCVQYLELETRKSARRRNMTELSHPAILLDKPLKAKLSPPELCESWVPVSHNEAEIKSALDRLRQEMNYFFFIKMLDEIGLPPDEVFPFPTRLNQMTLDFPDS